MKCYRDADGKWVGTQAEAGNKNAIEIPTTSKPEFLEWLNSREDPVSDAAPDRCAKCNLTPSQAREAAERTVAGMHADAIASYLETCPNGRVADVFVALADRFQQR